MDRRQRHAIATFVSDRTPRPLMAPLLSFDLSAEAANLESEPGWSVHRHNARTLLKHSEFRLVLIALEPGERIKSRCADERICIQILSGGLLIRAAGELRELKPAELLSLDRGLPYQIEATERCSLLLWVGWSGDPRSPVRGGTEES